MVFEQVAAHPPGLGHRNPAGAGRVVAAANPGQVAGREFETEGVGDGAAPQRGANAKGKKKGEDKPRGPIPMKNTGRSFSLDDVDATDDEMPEIDDVATSKPSDDLDKDEE